jgi:hypothetical protein
VTELLASLVLLIGATESAAELARNVKRRVFPLFDRIWGLRAFTDETLFSVCRLLDALEKRIGKAVNIQLQKPSIRNLLMAAAHSSDQILVRGAGKLGMRLARA